MRRMTLALAIVLSASAAARPASAGFFDFLFGTPDHAAEQKANAAA
jgi:hypothetical protein